MADARSWYVLCAFLSLIVSVSLNSNDGHSREKRAIPDGSLPRLVTKQGHMIFMSAENHNISFRSSKGGYINVNGIDLTATSNLVKSQKQAIRQLQQATSEIPVIKQRLVSAEDHTNVDTINTQITQIRAQLTTLQTNYQTQRTAAASLTGRVNTLTSQVTLVNSRYQRIRRLLRRNECTTSGNPCHNGGTCIDQYRSYKCLCPSAWKGTNCNEDVNECSQYLGTDLGCQNAATCRNLPGSYSCQCAGDWYGVRCTSKTDDCSVGSVAMCGHGTCVNSARTIAGQASYTCICNEGWTKNTQQNSPCTVDMNECSGQASSCSRDPPVTCINTPGSFTCGSCPAGYTGNGFSCADINECQVNPTLCSLSPRVDCMNTRGSYRCGSCPTGYRGNGVTCTFTGFCSNNNGGCHPQATCTENHAILSRTCQCPSGYVGNGVGVNGCVQSGSSCVSSPCQNNGACLRAGTSFTCACSAGFTGQLCQVNINECASNPCQNGGTCRDGDNTFSCTCTAIYTGPTCAQEQSSCGGRLRSATGSFHFPNPGITRTTGTTCVWIIRTTNFMVINATFSVFDLPNRGNCRSENVQVRDGGGVAAVLLGLFCGSRPPNTAIVSSRRKLYFMYRSAVAPSTTHNGITVTWRSLRPQCGGALNGSTGYLQSPGYPGRYPNNRNCVWTITVSPDKVIILTFGPINIEVHRTCSYDYLEIRDGLLATDTLLRRYCNRTSPPSVRTTGPGAYIKFHTDMNQADYGFRIHYTEMAGTTQCGGLKTAASGVITSPNYPQPYAHNRQCVWIITVATGSLVNVSFTAMDLEVATACPYDYVELRDGPTESSSLVSRYCGTDLPAIFVSATNSVWIRFRSDISVTGTGFRLQWTTACGGTFTAPTGTLQSPYYPLHYPSNRNCIYFISQPQGMLITLTFTAFAVEGQYSGIGCLYDYVEIHDGQNANSPLLVKRCGTNSPGVVVSTQNYMWMKFVTDGDTQNTGFSANYATSSSISAGGCGGTLTANLGVLSTPGHPNNHPHGINCTWFIRVSPGFIVQLHFTTFNIESSIRCNSDYVTISDNTTATSSVRYCGRTNPPIQTSTDNFMTVYFFADASIANQGFSASYVALNATNVCGNTLTSDTGIITSPNYPNNYPHHRRCEWTITIASGKQILLNITNFNLEYDNNCQWDYLEIRNGGYASSPLVGRYCGTTVDSIIRSHSNRMYLKFYTDSSVSHSGFSITYDGTAQGCGGDMTTPTGTFVSPNYPYPYGHRSTCQWTIAVSHGSKIILSFTDFNLEDHARCQYDYVLVSDRHRIPLRGRMCGPSIPMPVTSNDNMMRVRLRTDSSVSGRGFMASYGMICGQDLNQYQGVIESPNYPRGYPHSMNCTWKVHTTRGNRVNVTFITFDLETHSSCEYDKLQIRDGSSASSNELGTFCGGNIPPIIGSTQRNLWVRMTTDTSLSGTGFRLRYYTIGCGGVLNGRSGTFKSPNYPNRYDDNRVCEWRISVPTGMSVKITIPTIEMESHPACLHDALSVYAGLDDLGPLTTKICNTRTVPMVVTVTGNNAFVRFSTDASRHGRGFSANFVAVQGGCGGNLSTPTGAIHSPNYPNDYPRYVSCRWLINVTRSSLVVLNFTGTFDIEGSSGCSSDFVAAYDGPDETYPLIQRKFCGSGLPSPNILRSSSNVMFVKMLADYSIQGAGFRATFTSGCGGTLDADAGGAITSPNYPSRYSQNSNCSYLLHSEDTSKKISLTFTHLDLESYRNCSNDYVAVYDGTSALSPRKGIYCGTTIPATITTDGSDMYVRFITDRGIQQSGFRAVYTSSTSVCGASFTSMHGAFNSPGYPDSFYPNTECVWTIETSQGNRISLSFPVFELPTDPFCNDNYLEFRKTDIQGDLIGRFCGTNTPANITHMSSLWIKLRSSAQATGQGFMANYVTDTEVSLNAQRGVIESPLFGHLLPSNIDFAWIITVNSYFIVATIMLNVDIEAGHQGSSCPYDYVLFRDGGLATSTVLKRVCGTFNYKRIPYSSGNQVRIELHTDRSVAGMGFTIRWFASSRHTGYRPQSAGNCGGDLNTTVESVQWFTSPGFPSGYNTSLRCEWLISVPIGYQVKANIVRIRMGGSYRCRYRGRYRSEAVVFSARRQNGGNNMIYTLGRYCRWRRNSRPIISPGNTMSVTFTSALYQTRYRQYQGFNATYTAVCGGIVTTPTEPIKSPNYPGQYGNNQNCTWILTVPRGRTIQMIFSQFNLYSGTNANCNADYVLLLNGDNANSPPLGNQNGRYCGTSVPSVAESSDNAIYVSFISDRSNSGTGFVFTWREITVACGGTYYLSDDLGTMTVQSPNYPSNYQHNIDCNWVIIGPATERLQAHFLQPFGVVSSYRCTRDTVSLRDGGTLNSPTLGNFCGANTPATQVTTGNAMYIRFRTTNTYRRPSQTYQGFKATIQIATCGGRINSGLVPTFVTSNNYPENYDNNADCVWILVVPAGHFMTIHFESFSVQYSSNCSANGIDALVIRDYNATGTVLQAMCGSTIPADVVTPQSIAHVSFKSDSSVNNRGFKFSFTASRQVCGGILDTPTGIFTSPNYPNPYPNRRRCQWKIKVARGRKVTLTFDAMDLETTNENSCYYDYILIKNGWQRDSPTLGRRCGTNTTSISSSGRFMQVNFVSDYRTSNSGFKARYSSDESADCGGTLNARAGNFSSPGFPSGNFSSKLECYWFLPNPVIANTTGNASSIDHYSLTLSWVRKQLRFDDECRNQRVQYFIGGNDENFGELVGTWCGNASIRAPFVITASPLVVVRFVSQVNLVGQQFQIRYNFTQCGGLLTSDSGVISSPNYPSHFNLRERCSWIIKAPEGSKIVVNFRDFDIEPQRTCLYDYVELFNGGLMSSPSIGKFCNRTLPPNFSSQSNALRVVFLSDNYRNSRGFQMTYHFTTEGCGGLLHGLTGYINSPDYPANYPHNTECTYDINVPLGYRLRLSFNNPFDIQQSVNCTNDYVTVKDVLSNGTQVLLGKKCGRVTPQAFNSSSKNLVVKFRSDSSSNGVGFSANWTSTCGAILTDPRGYLISPGYPYNYGNNLRCNYKIIAGSDTYVVLMFTGRFDIRGNRYSRNSRYCSADYLGISAIRSRTYYRRYHRSYYRSYYRRYNRRQRLCGTTRPQAIATRGTMVLRFYTDWRVTGTGFSAHYLTNDCGGLRTASSGIIQSPTRPAKYLNGMDCSWFINVSANKVVSIRFYMLKIEHHNRCSYDSLTFYDGNSTSARMIGRYCGNQIPTNIKSTNNSMYIRFTTDSSVTNDGFRFRYFETIGPEQGCGGVLNATSGSIVSPVDVGGLHHDNLMCVWIISVPRNSVINYTVTSASIERGGSSCYYDNLKIIDGMFKFDPLIRKICGNLTSPYSILTSSNNLRLVFYTDSSVRYPGFNSSYTTAVALCGGVFTATSTPQNITSLGYPSSFNVQRCRWTIDAPSGQRVRITTKSFQILTTDCTNNYMELRDSPLGRRGRTHLYCGTNTPPTFDSVSRTANVNSVATLSSTNSTGFMLQFQIADCNQIFTASNDRITNPRWPNHHYNNENCVIRITTAADTTIAIYFNSFRLESHSSCGYDYLEIRNGTTRTNSSLISKLCGHDLPAPIFVNGNQVWMNFRTDSSGTYAGYDITYVASTAGLGCGGSLSSINGTLTNPLYPSNDTSTTAHNCDWVIRAPNNRRITIRVDALRVDGTANCTLDYIQIRSGVNAQARLVTTLCSTPPSNNLRIQGSTAFVRYHTNGVGPSLIFRLRYFTGINPIYINRQVSTFSGVMAPTLMG